MKKYLSLINFAIAILLLVQLPASAQQVPIDKVIAVVGREMISLSDIENEITMMKFQGIVSENNIRCEVLESLLLQKLLIAQARIDSLRVDENMVEQQIDRRLRMIITQLGSEKATEDYFKKPLFKIKQDWSEPMREQILTQLMQQKLMKDAPIAPSDVEKFYNKIPKDSLPTMSTAYVVRQIVLNPPTSTAAFDVREQLLHIRERIMKGEKFNTLAVLYSQDPASAKRGGELGLRSAQDYEVSFAEAAMALKPGQISQIIETQYGFHLIQLISKEGNDMINCRHILLKPQYATEHRVSAFAKLDSIANLIKNDSLSFENAAQQFSEDKTTRTAGGLVISEESNSAVFEKDQLSPYDYQAIRELKEGEISAPYEALDSKGNTQYKIMLLVKITPSHVANIKDDYNLIQQLAKQERRQDSLNKWMSEKQEYTYIRIDPSFHDCKFERKGWIK